MMGTKLQKNVKLNRHMNHNLLKNTFLIIPSLCGPKIISIIMKTMNQFFG